MLAAWVAPATVLGLVVPPASPLAPAGASEPAAEAEDGLTSRLNEDRVTARLAAVVPEDDLAAVARRHSQQMVTGNRLFHNPSLAEQVKGWKVLGENVGKGASVEEVHRAFMASGVHRARILDHRFTGVGVGVVHSGGEIWVTQVFRQRLDPHSSPAAEPPATSAPAPPAPPAVERPAGAAAVSGRPVAGPAAAASGRSSSGRAAPDASGAATTTTSIPTTTAEPSSAGSTSDVTSVLAPAAPGGGRRAAGVAPAAPASLATVPAGSETTAVGTAAAALLWAVAAASLAMWRMTRMTRVGSRYPGRGG